MALYVLQAIAFALLALGVVARLAPGRAPILTVVACMAGLAAALLAPPATVDAGLSFEVDGLSSVMLAALFLLGMTGAAPAALGALTLAVLAADGATLALFLAGAVAAQALGRPAAEGRGFVRLLPVPWAAGWGEGVAGLACLVVALALLLWPDPHFAAVRAVSPEGLRAMLILAGALGAAVLLPGGLIGVYLIARLLLDQAGAAPPGWWGAPVLLLGAAVAVLGARRAAAADDLAEVGRDAVQAAQGIAIMGLGVALLARGADLPAVAALAAAGALLQVLSLALWGGLIGGCAAAIRDAVGGTALVRLGGLLRRSPVAGLALLAALLSMAAMPLSAGFAGVWVVLQALLGAARAGGVGGVLLAAVAASALGLAVALLAAAAVRLGGVALLGAPRTAKAAVAPEPGAPVRLGLAAMTVAVLALGIWPWPGMMFVQPGVRLLNGAAGGDPAAPFHAAPAIAALLVGLVMAVAWLGRGAPAPAAPWRGGFAEEGAARGNTWPLILWPGWRDWRPPSAARVGLVALALALAAAVGWAAR
jgi:hydrogenase-4 component B